MSEVLVNIDGRELRGNPGQIVLDLARANDIEIPSLCYSPLVEPFGSCGMCLIEVEGSPKLLRSCATEVQDGMIVFTQTPQLTSARRMALELLLSDHVGDCRSPCHMACPAGQDPQGYIALLANDHPREALALIKETLPLPACIGRICPHPCEEACRRELKEEPLAICSLKRYAADVDLGSEEPYQPRSAEPSGRRVAIVGAGPAGLSAGYFLTLAGHQVDIFESLPQAGGMLRYGIPEYRLPKEVLDQEIRLITELGVTIHTNSTLGQDFSLSHLFNQGFNAVFLALGAQASRSAMCEGEDLDGVYGGVEFLRQVCLTGQIAVGSRVAVIGGGNTAMDAARTALRLGAAEVSVLYRRTRQEMPASPVEVEEALEEGVQMQFLTAPLAIQGNGRARELMCQRMELGEPDESGRCRPEPISGSEFTVKADTVILAIGQSPVLNGLDAQVATGRGDTVTVTENTYETSMPGVFAGGDLVTGPDIAIQAVAQGKEAAQVIDSYLQGQIRAIHRPFILEREEVPAEEFAEWPEQARQSQETIPPERRVKDFREFVSGLTSEQVEAETRRCLECGCLDVFECQLKAYSDSYQVQADRLQGEVNEGPIDLHPFIQRDPEKCILCGQCVLTCDSIRGAGVLSFVNRGFSVVVNPAFDVPLLESECQACGQCVSSCPTGAITSRAALPKPGPWEPEGTESTCGYCSVGCQISTQTRGTMLVEVLPSKNGTLDRGNLCRKGRYGHLALRDSQRITEPWVRHDGVLQPVSWDYALTHLAKGIISARATAGGSGTAVFASGRLTNEELYLIQKLSRTVLGTNHVNSLAISGPDPMAQVTGLAAGTTSMADVAAAETLFLVGTRDLCYTHSILGLQILEAQRRGARVIYLGCGAPARPDLMSRSLELPDGTDTAVLEGLIAQLLEDQVLPTPEQGQLDQLEALAQQLTPFDWAQLQRDTGLERQDLVELNKQWMESRTAIALFDEAILTPSAARLLTIWTAITGKLGRPRRGLIPLRRKNNSQGLWDMGINPELFPGQLAINSDSAARLGALWNTSLAPEPGLYTEDVLSQAQQGHLKALLVFGEDPLGSSSQANRWAQALPDLPLLMVQDAYWTETARAGAVVLPGATPLETRGTATNLERRVQKVNPAFSPPAGYQNWEALVLLARSCGRQWNYPYLETLQAEIISANPLWQAPDFARSLQSRGNAQWGGPVLHQHSYSTADGQPNLSCPKRAALQQPVELTHAEYMETSFAAHLSAQGFRA